MAKSGNSKKANKPAKRSLPLRRIDRNNGTQKAKANKDANPKLDGPKIGAIKRAIEKYISVDGKRSDLYVKYKNWYCGITNDTKTRKARHQKEKNIAALYFNAWDASTLDNAGEIERHFHDLGMKDKKGKRGAKENSIWVYVFKIEPNMIDEIAYLFGVIQ